MQKTALAKLIETDKNLREFGFNWPNLEMIFDKIESEFHEVKDASKSAINNLQEEIGDLLHTILSLCIYTGFDIEETIYKADNKLQKRLDALKIIAKKNGYNSLKGQDIEYMLQLWNEVKKNESL